jgi:hypothetical protein
MKMGGKVFMNWDCGKCGKYSRSMDVNQPQYLSPAEGGRGILWPEQLLILVTQLKKQ